MEIPQNPQESESPEGEPRGTESAPEGHIPEGQGLDPSDPLVVMTTLPDPTQAQALAKVLVEEGLVACAQILPGMQSLYRWQGKLHQDAECLVLLKTLVGRFGALEERLGALHPYSVPELIGLPAVRWSQAYGAWVAEQTRPQD